MEWKSGKGLGANTFIETTQLTRKHAPVRPQGTIADVLRMLRGGGTLPLHQLEGAFPGAERLVEKLVKAGFIDVQDGQGRLSDEGESYYKSL